MELITGITGAAAGPEVRETLPAQMELPLEAEAPTEPTHEPAAIQPIPDVEPEPVVEEAKGPPVGLEERSFTLLGRVIQFVMRTIAPSAWQNVVQQMAEQMPASITLEPRQELEWKHERHHQELLEELHDQGFLEAGMFYAEDMHSNLHLLINEAYDLRAVLYENENSGVVLDLVTLYGDGTGVTYVNREDPGFAQSPLHPNVYMGHVPVYELLDSCLHERPKKAMLPQGIATAAQITELEYKFGARRLRGEPVNPVEMAEAYLNVISPGSSGGVEEEQVVEESPDAAAERVNAMAAGKN